MTTWVHCNAETGAIATIGVSVNDYEASLQVPPPGMVGFSLPDGLILDPYSATPDLSRCAAWLCDKIDRDAGALRSRLVTLAPGQEMVYCLKIAEAREWAPGARDEAFPFLSSEAESTGKSIADVRAAVIEKVSHYTALAAQIEGKRIGAKLAVKAAILLPDLVKASMVAWPDVPQA